MSNPNLPHNERSVPRHHERALAAAAGLIGVVALTGCNQESTPVDHQPPTKHEKVLESIQNVELGHDSVFVSGEIEADTAPSVTFERTIIDMAEAAGVQLQPGQTEVSLEVTKRIVRDTEERSGRFIRAGDPFVAWMDDNGYFVGATPETTPQDD